MIINYNIALSIKLNALKKVERNLKNLSEYFSEFTE